jgi:excisionase family DNA binding protein
MEQLAFTVAEACRIARVGRTALYQAISSGALTARKRGRKTLLLPADLQKWIQSLPTFEPRDQNIKSVNKNEDLATRIK